MPLTAAQRQAERQKLKDSDQYEDYKKKNAEQQCLVTAKKRKPQLPMSEKNKLQAE